MLKELLLQFVVSLLPAVSYQLWHETAGNRRKRRLLVSFISAVSLISCIFLYDDFIGYAFDFRVVPYLIGALYGGTTAIVTLSALYIGTEAFLFDNIRDCIASTGLILILAVWLLKYAGTFRASPTRHKVKIGIYSAGFVIFYKALHLQYDIQINKLSWTPATELALVVYMIACPLAIHLSIAIIELLQRNKRLQDEIRIVSANYRNQAEKLQQLIDETNFAVLLVDENGRLTHINEIGMKLFALAANDGGTDYFIGWNYNDIFDPAASDLCINLLNKALAGERMALEPLVGEEKIYLKKSFPLYSADDDRIAGAALIVQDITEMYRLRNEVGRMERLSLVGQMAASITHEIRNPMAVIRGFVQLMREKSPSDQQQYFRIVMDELDRANNIISDFLSLAQNRVLTMEPGSLNEIILTIFPLLEADANMRGQAVQLELDDVPDMIMNEKEMKQLLLNLARNGMEAMTDKGMLHIATKLEDGYISLTVRDEGTGIPQHKIKRLFEPFFTTKQRGTGLGLPLCLSIAERHSGRIDVISKLGEGTSFIVTFDLAANHKEPRGRAYYETGS